MTEEKLALINERTSPLFRMMWIHSPENLTYRFFDNNISAFHIGNGFILSVAHNLRTEMGYIRSLSAEIYNRELLPLLNSDQVVLFNRSYTLNTSDNRMYFSTTNPDDPQSISAIFKQINFDTRWIRLMKEGACHPYLVIQLREDQFYGNSHVTSLFNQNSYFYEPLLNKHTFLIKLELIEAYYEKDIALYRIVDTPPEIVALLPKIKVNFSILDQPESLFCVQSAPSSALGSLVNKAEIEGFLEQHAIFSDRFDGQYIMEGNRYLIKGYFRFGSSGAPYVTFNNTTHQFEVNAIQSQACPQQLTIGGAMDGNFQYINAIATPLNLIETDLKRHLES